MIIGLIGCGRVAKWHMFIYRHLENARVVGFSDIDLKKAKHFAVKYGANKFFSNYVDLLETKNLDFVDICTPPSTHSRIVCDAAKFGHNILVEKPMALSTAECNKMIHEAKSHGVKLCVCHNQLFIPSVKRLESMVDSGFCDPVSFRISYKQNEESTASPAWALTPEEKGILWEMGYHTAYHQLEFLKNITAVYASGSKVKYPVYDNFAVLLQTSNQSYGIIEVSMLAREPELICEIEWSDGKRVQVDISKDTLIEKGTKERSSRHSSGLKGILRHIVSPPKTLRTKMGYFIGHYNLIKEYMESLENDTLPPVQPEKGKNTIKLLESIKESLNNHQIVPMKSFS